MEDETCKSTWFNLKTLSYRITLTRRCSCRRTIFDIPEKLISAFFPSPLDERRFYTNDTSTRKPIIICIYMCAHCRTTWNKFTSKYALVLNSTSYYHFYLGYQTRSSVENKYKCVGTIKSEWIWFQYIRYG